MITLYTITLTVACCVAVTLALASDRRGRGGGSWASTATLAALSAICATLSTLAYAMAGPNDEHLVPLIIGDVSMPLCLVLLLTAVRLAAGKRSRPFASVLICLGVGATTLFVSPEAGQSAKLLTLTMYSWVIAVTCARGRLPERGRWLIGVTTTVYGAYCLARFAWPIIMHEDAPLVAVVFEQGPATIVAAAAVAAIAIGMIDIVRQSQDQDVETSAIVSREALTNWIAALLTQRSEVTAIAVSIPELPLHRAAFGRNWAQTAASAATRATRAEMPVGSVVGTVAPSTLVALQFGAVTDLDAVAARLQETYESMIPDGGPTKAPELRVELLTISQIADVRRFARQSRNTARRALASQGV